MKSIIGAEVAEGEIRGGIGHRAAGRQGQKEEQGQCDQ
jgi:hypothetical protein